MKFLIAGGAGSVGQALTAFFIQKENYPKVKAEVEGEIS